MDTLDTYFRKLYYFFFYLNCLFNADDDVPENVLKLLADDDIRIVTTDQQHIWNWTVAQGLQWHYNECLKEEEKSYKMQWQCTNSKGSSSEDS
jgi:hypothetical protein